MLNPEQYALLKADIMADNTITSATSDVDASYAVQALYNMTAFPPYYVWRTNVPSDEIMKNGMDWTQVDNLTVGKARIWDWMTRLGVLDFSKQNIRAGIEAAWVGTAPMLAVRAAIYLHGYRLATRFEKLLASGKGTTASPSTMGVNGEGLVSQQDIYFARNS